MNFLIAIVFLISVQTINCYKTYADLYASKLCTDKKFTILYNMIANKQSKIELHGHSSESAAIVNHTWSAADVKRSSRPCVFRVEVKREYPNRLGGIYITLQHLNLRRRRNGDCLDYVQFKMSNLQPSEKYCSDPDGIIFDQDARGRIEVSVYIDPNTILPPTELLTMSLVFTAFQLCEQDEQEKFMCIPDSNMSCISRTFLRDGINNCPPPYCSDEDNHCIVLADPPLEPVDKKNIIISAITSLIFTMVGVSSCVYLCYKYRVCFSECTKTTSVRAQAHEAPSIEMPTAPVIEIHSTPAPRYEEKDLPPSYDVLFPDR